MKVVNVHQRLLHASPEEVDAVLATLGSPHDKAWPRTGWPRMVLDRPLAVGARGGHGPIRYVVESREPGFAAFRFTNVRFLMAAMSGARRHAPCRRARHAN